MKLRLLSIVKSLVLSMIVISANGQHSVLFEPVSGGSFDFMPGKFSIHESSTVNSTTKVGFDLMNLTTSFVIMDLDNGVNMFNLMEHNYINRYYSNYGNLLDFNTMVDNGSQHIALSLSGSSKKFLNITALASSNGGFNWQRSYNERIAFGKATLIEDAAGDYLIAWSRKRNNNEVNIAINSGLGILKLSPLGNEIWQEVIVSPAVPGTIIGNPEYEVIDIIENDNNNSYILFGMVMIGQTDPDMFIVEIDKTTGQLTQQYLTAFGGDLLTLDFTGTADANFNAELYNNELLVFYHNGNAGFGLRKFMLPNWSLSPVYKEYNPPPTSFEAVVQDVEIDQQNNKVYALIFLSSCNCPVVTEINPSNLNLVNAKKMSDENTSPINLEIFQDKIFVFSTDLDEYRILEYKNTCASQTQSFSNYLATISQSSIPIQIHTGVGYLEESTELSVTPYTGLTQSNCDNSITSSHKTAITSVKENVEDYKIVQSNGELFIKGRHDYSVSIYDSKGMLISRGINEINTSNFSSGIYLLRIETEDGFEGVERLFIE